MTVVSVGSSPNVTSMNVYTVVYRTGRVVSGNWCGNEWNRGTATWFSSVIPDLVRSDGDTWRVSRTVVPSVSSNIVFGVDGFDYSMTHGGVGV